MGGVRVETRRVDGSGWVRAVGEVAEAIGTWVQHNTDMVLVGVGAVLAAMLILRLLIRGGFRRSVRR